MTKDRTNISWTEKAKSRSHLVKMESWMPSCGNRAGISPLCTGMSNEYLILFSQTVKGSLLEIFYIKNKSQ